MWNTKGIRTVRKIIKNCNNVSPRTLGRTIAAEAWTNIPDEIETGIFDKVAEKRDNLAYFVPNDRKQTAGGSGAQVSVPGQAVACDYIGKWQTTTFAATGAALLMDIATGFGQVYGTASKSAMSAALGTYIIFMRSNGHTVKEAYLMQRRKLVPASRIKQWNLHIDKARSGLKRPLKRKD